ncbi:hypothetical protein [Streptomyces prasinosporus]
MTVSRPSVVLRPGSDGVYAVRVIRHSFGGRPRARSGRARGR